ncbi:MAG: DUF6057 family protein [Marinilabiliaceae bacterium]|nr:DUF6057 family protein [Marinilabiliaceae bacterium]
MNIRPRQIHICVSAIAFVAIWLLWSLGYTGHMNFHEQLQCFLFTTDYVQQTLSCPGGFADLVARYLTQFYFYDWVGGFVIASLIISIQYLTWLIISKISAKDICYSLSFAPAIAALYFYADVNNMLSAVVAILLGLATAWGIAFLRHKPLLFTTITIVITPIIYALLGTLGAVTFVSTYAATLLFTSVDVSLSKKIMSIVACLVTIIIAIGIARQTTNYQLIHLVKGINYSRFPLMFATSAYVSALLIFISAVCTYIIHIKNINPNSMIGYAMAYIVTFAAMMNYDIEQDRAMRYDKYVRNQDWKSVIEAANHDMPTQPIVLNYVNLALGMTNQLADKTFYYSQHGVDCLFMPFVRNLVSITPASEVFYYMGLTNIAQRYSFEAMMAIPDGQLSCRFIKRLAETEIINEQYDVARKYLIMLSHTMFYDNWARENLSMINNNETYSDNSEIGRLRRYRVKEDYLCSEDEIDKMMMKLYLGCTENKMAFEYATIMQLFKKDLNSFFNYLPFGGRAKYNSVPCSFQEAIMYHWSQTHNDLKDMPKNVSPKVKESMMNYIHTYMNNKNNIEAMEPYKHTFWYYYMFSQN